MLKESTLTAIHQISTDVNLKIDVREFAIFLSSLGILPDEEQKEITWTATGMAIAKANKEILTNNGGF